MLLKFLPVTRFTISIYIALCTSGFISALPAPRSKGMFYKGLQHSSSTSPTISVQRFGASTFYNYVQTVPTEASLVSSALVASSQNISPRLAVHAKTFYSNGISGSDSLQEGNPDARTTDSTLIVPTSSQSSQADTNEGTIVPVISEDNPSSGSESAPSQPDTSDGTSANQPPPAEAVPGQPSDADAESSSSEESSSSSSSSEEDYFKLNQKLKRLIR